ISRRIPMDRTCLALIVLLGCTVAWGETAPPTVTCKDGSASKGGRGACRGHGGVDKTKAAAEGAPTPAPAPAAKPTPPPAASAIPRSTTPATIAGVKGETHAKAATSDAAGAIAKCKDGTYWHGTKHSGSCSHHGGVDSWLDGTNRN